MPPVISKGERVVMYFLTAMADFFQLIFTPTAVAGDGVDIFIGALLIGYALKRKLFSPLKAVLFAATIAGEAVPFVNAAPFWTLDLINLYSGTLMEEPPQIPDYDGPPNQNGVRRPNKQPPLNPGNNTRPPRKV